MSRRAKTLCIVAALCLALLAAGLVTAHAWRTQPVVLEFGMFVGSNWGVANANSYTIIDRAIRQFEAEHPGVTIRYDSGILKTDYSEWLSRKLIAGDMPDVFMVLSSDFHLLGSLGALTDLDRLMRETPEFDESAFFSSALSIGRYAGNQYALPYEIVPTLMFVNKSLLLSEGIQMPTQNWTWEDFYAICRQVTQDIDGNGSLDRFGTYNYNWRDVVFTNGISLFDEDGDRAHFSDERMIEAIRFSKQIYDLNQGQKVTQEDFDNGNVAFMPLAFAEYRTYKTYPYKIKKYTNFQWDCITLPAGPNGGNISEVDAMLLGISSQTRHQQLAWEFLMLLTSNEDIQMDIFRYSQGASVLKGVTSSREVDEILQEDMEKGERIIDNELLSRVIEEGIIKPKFPGYEEAVALAEHEISKIMELDKSIDSTLKLVQRSVKKYLNEP